MSIFGLFRLRQYKKCTHKCLWVHFICSDFWYFLELSSKRHRLKPFEFSPHGLTDRLRLNCEPSSPMNAFSHILCSWARNRRNGVRFLKRPQNVSRSFRRSSPTFHFWTRFLTSYVVELGLTRLTSTSWYARTTCSKPLASYQSSDSVLSVRPRIL